jgi:hypothetical protein
MMTMRALLATAVLSLSIGALPAAADTPSAVCALDSLRLVSPASLEIGLSTTGRFGAVISWPVLDDATTTCAVPVDTAGLGFLVTLDGAYKDDFDRKLLWTCLFGGEVGSSTKNSVLITWSNLNQAVTGRILGEVNLSNNGGVLALGEDGAWSQANAGLPPYLSKVDVNVLAEAPTSPGTLLATLSDRRNRGLWLKPGPESDWRRLAPELFPDGTLSDSGVSALVFAPDDALTFLVGTSKSGVYLTRDGGQTFAQQQVQFSPGGTWSLRRVTDIVWNRPEALYVAINGLGLYVSADRGASYANLVTLRVPQNFPTGGGVTTPVINRIVDQGGRLLVGVNTFGLYNSDDGGASWHWTWDELLDPGAQPISVTDLAVDPADPLVIMAGTTDKGIWWTGNGGRVWFRVGASVAWPNPATRPAIRSLVLDAVRGLYLATADGFGVLTCARGDTVWTQDGLAQPSNRSLTRLFTAAQTGVRYWLATYGGGIYIPGTPLRLSDTIKKAQTDLQYQNLDFGLTVSFGAGSVADSTSFSLLAQDFQGYAVWRGEGLDLDEMQLIGFYDKSNPESCIEGYCGDTSYNATPNCYADKRAACFDFSNPVVATFFDDSIYEGFDYYYAVTTFDYGNIATVTPSSLTAERLYSTRYPGDLLSLFGGVGNRTRFFVSQPAAGAVEGPEIYAYPNPLRQAAGFSGSEGEKVTFKNLPPGSRIQIFTLDGDQVANLGPESQIDNLMPWVTRNDHGELLASDVYIYKVEMPSRDDFYGKVVIIR